MQSNLIIMKAPQQLPIVAAGLVVHIRYDASIRIVVSIPKRMDCFCIVTIIGPNGESSASQSVYGKAFLHTWYVSAHAQMQLVPQPHPVSHRCG